MHVRAGWQFDSVFWCRFYEILDGRRSFKLVELLRTLIPGMTPTPLRSGVHTICNGMKGPVTHRDEVLAK